MSRWLAPLAALLIASGCGGSGGTAAATDDSAGSWRTWVLAAAGDVEVPAPSAGAEVRAEPEPDPAAPAVEPWLDRAMALVSRRPKDPVTASRNYALVAVAMYDAAVAAEHWQAEHGVDGYPSTRAAIAGAGSRVIAYAFPEHPAARLDADAEAAAGPGAGAAAGLALGRGVAERVIAYARADGSDAAWDGRRPRFRGAWEPPPGSAARPVAPTGGTWKTWVMTSGRQFRPPPPPRYGSPRYMRELREVVAVRSGLTAEQKRIAEFWAGGDGTELPPGRWIKVVLEYLRGQPAMSEARAARVFALVTVAMADGGVAAWDAKYAYWTVRPENAIRDLLPEPGWKPHLSTPFFPAYVSGHATYSGAAAEVLAHLFPADAELWRERAEEAAVSRLYGGIHFRADNEAGMRMGVRIGRLVVARARADGAER